MVLLSLFLPGCAAVQQEVAAPDSAVLLTDARGFYNLAPHVFYIEDPEGILSISDILSQGNPTVNSFRPSASETFNRGLNTSYFWLRLTVRNEQSEHHDWRLEIGPSSIDQLEVYLPKTDGRVVVWETGDQKPFEQREIAYRSFVFSLDVPRNTSQVVYIRFQNKAQSRMSLYLWSEPGFAAFQTREQFFLGLFYGSLVVVWNYSLLLLLSLRQRLSWHYSMLVVALISTLLLFVSDGLAYWLVWPSAVRFNDAALLTLWALTVASIVYLVRRFLEIETGQVRLNRFLQPVLIIWLVLAALNILLDHWLVAWTIHLLTIPALLLFGIVGLRLFSSLSGRLRVYPLFMVLAVVLNLPLVFSYLLPGYFWLDPLLNIRLLTLLFLVMASLAIRERYDLLVFQQIEAEQAAARAALENERLIRDQSNHLAAQVEQLHKELTALLDLTVLVTDDRNWEDILAPMLTSMLEAGGLDAVAVHMLLEESRNLKLLAQKGLSDFALLHLEDLELLSTSLQVLMQTPASVQLAELKLDKYRQFLCLPLKVHGLPFGLLTVYRNMDRPFSLDQIAILAAFATYLSVKIENQRLRLEAEQRAVDLERQRMARDLHDSLNQSIYSLALLARASRDAQDEGAVERLAENLTLLEEYAHLALGEMRLLLYQLRPPELEILGLSGALNARFDLVERRTGLLAEVSAPDHLHLAPAVELELYRISIEALNNTLKHAHATQVRVILTDNGKGSLVMCIEDNGIGFDHTATSQGMGINNMKARAAQINAQLSVEDLPGGGTRLCVTTLLSKGQY